MRKLSWLLAGLFLLSLYGWFDNRISYKYEAEFAEKKLLATGGSQVELANVRVRGQQLDQQLLFLKSASIGLIIAISLSVYKTPKA
ncbi:hypothetical protein [Hymenobacter glacialis]|uniref:Uncharacterized protein n=1 Tax=Hymenobacter glacialis TaxID=1908236 RepID=A0A1G1T459_9BACT|nr:hypothetical protein [Hymenobacter glacialis]OGX85647.1 hypothetical protein BEN48_02130 [Hymenobacter glacialis]